MHQVRNHWRKITIMETNDSAQGCSHLHLLLPSVALKLLTLECQQTALSKSPQSELQFSFLFFSCLFLFFLLSFFWWATEPFPRLCMHQQTCWYDLKGHVLFTLTEAFQNSDEGVPLKDSAVTLRRQRQQLELKPNWLMLYIKSPFFPIQPAFPGLVMPNQDGPSAPVLGAPWSYSLRYKRINWLSLMSSTRLHFWSSIQSM